LIRRRLFSNTIKKTLRKHINCRVGNFSMRPGSIEFQWNSKTIEA
jgi:hypothetical protein